MNARVLGIISLIFLLVCLLYTILGKNEENQKRINSIVGIFAVIAVLLPIVFPEKVAEYIDPNVERYKEENDSLNSTIEDLELQINNLEEENARLKEQIGIVETDTSVETNLFEMQPIVGQKQDIVKSSVDFIDNVGNNYPNGYSIYYDGNGNEDNREATYLLEKKYKTLSGKIALRNNENDIRDGVWVEFYDNNTLIYQTDHLYAGVLPIEFSVDVSQIDRLKVKANGGDQFAFILTSGFYLE